MKRINELFDVEEDFKVLSLHSDSRYVGKDSVFFCIEGLTTDGHRYADDAVFQGAKAIVHSAPLRKKYPGVLYIEVKDVLDELNRVVNIFYDYPSYKMTVIGVTGTSGKTVVALTIRDVLSRYLKMGYIGTNDAQYGSSVIQSSYTTPESIFMHRTLNEMVKSSVKGATIEVSSHGLALKRVDSINFDIAVFTNVHDEHLDFHGTLENVMKAKTKLFELLDEKGYCILNADEVRFNHYLEKNGHVKAHKIFYGIDHHADIMAKRINVFLDHTEFDLFIRDEVFHVSVPVIGKFNVSNTLAVLATLMALEMTTEQIVDALNYIGNVDGRMELIKTGHNFNIIVDYCPYISAYSEVFKFARSVTKKPGRIIAVFGISFKRDTEKKRKLAKLINQYCDQVILTQEDSGEDEVLDLCDDMLNMIECTSLIITDRRIAIRQAIELACDQDLILILGKGHEQFMKTSVGNIPYPGDKYIAKKAIEEIYKGDDYEL